MRGTERSGGDYESQRGWYDAGVQAVMKKWSGTINEDVIREVFLRMERVHEQGENDYNLVVHRREDLQFAHELMLALEKLFHPKNCAGWVVKLSSRMQDASKRTPGASDKWRLMPYSDMAKEIEKETTFKFSEDALRKAAQRLRLTE